MTTFIALPFTELPVRVEEEPDPTCLVRIDREPMDIVGRISIYCRTIHVKTENGWECRTPKAVPVLQVVARKEEE